MHQHVRTTLWGYAADETLENEALIAEKYRGIRPAPGYPACPDHNQKRVLFDLLKVTESTGISLTDESGDVSSGICKRMVLFAPGGAVFQHCSDWRGSSLGLRETHRYGN